MRDRILLMGNAAANLTVNVNLTVSPCELNWLKCQCQSKKSVTLQLAVAVGGGKKISNGLKNGWQAVSSMCVNKVMLFATDKWLEGQWPWSSRSWISTFSSVSWALVFRPPGEQALLYEPDFVASHNTVEKNKRAENNDTKKQWSWKGHSKVLTTPDPLRPSYRKGLLSSWDPSENKSFIASRRSTSNLNWTNCFNLPHQSQKKLKLVLIINFSKSAISKIAYDQRSKFRIKN